MLWSSMFVTIIGTINRSFNVSLMWSVFALSKYKFNGQIFFLVLHSCTCLHFMVGISNGCGMGCTKPVEHHGKAKVCLQLPDELLMQQEWMPSEWNT